MTQIQFLTVASNKGPWGTTEKREQVRGTWDFSLPKPSDNKMHRDTSSKVLPAPQVPHHMQPHSEPVPRPHAPNGLALIASNGHVSRSPELWPCHMAFSTCDSWLGASPRITLCYTMPLASYTHDKYPLPLPLDGTIVIPILRTP